MGDRVVIAVEADIGACSVKSHTAFVPATLTLRGQWAALTRYLEVDEARSRTITRQFRLTPKFAGRLTFRLNLVGGSPPPASTPPLTLRERPEVSILTKTQPRLLS
jgi:hypothetical protein